MTNPMKNPFTQHSKSSSVLPTATAEFFKNSQVMKHKASFPRAHCLLDNKKRKQTLAVQITKPSLPSQDLSSQCETETEQHDTESACGAECQ